jgi:Family of unknown function (DUF6785)/Domain of unknown function (DUF6784)
MAEAEARILPFSSVPGPDRAPWVGLTVRALALAVLLTLLCALWVDQAEVVTFFCQITESVPPIPAIAVIIALVLLNPFLSRVWRRLALRRGEILLVYAFLTVTMTLPGCGIARFFLNTVPVLFYFDTPENRFAEYRQYLPQWMVPHDSEVMRQLYEGSPGGRIPWGSWWLPLTMWMIFYLALFAAMLCLMAALRRQWSEREKLTYPLLYLPLDLASEEQPRGLVPEFLRNRVMWVGFGVAAIYNLLNIVNAYNPAVKCLGKYYDLGALFTEHPYTALRPLVFHYRPDMVGFGYLVSTEVAMSVGAFYLLSKLESLGAAMMGYTKAGFPFEQEQGIGAYVAMAIFLVWVARRHLADVIGKAFGRGRDALDEDEPMSYRTAVFGFLAATAVGMAWTARAGMAQWVWLLYYALILAVALVYARIRAEVGVPQIWMFPYYQTYKVIKFTLGSELLRVGGSWRTLTVLTTLVPLSRGYFQSLQGYQTEAFRLAELGGVRPRSMSRALVMSLVVGMAVAWWLHLRSYYEYGAGGVRALEGWGAGLAKEQYTELTGYADAPGVRDVPRTLAAALGFGFAGLLTIARLIFLRFPLHPLAYCMTTSYGELIWGSFVLVWLVKSAVFKVGGMRTYRRLIPGFIGLALGHFFTSGVLYGLVGAYGDESFRRYQIWFG